MSQRHRHHIKAGNRALKQVRQFQVSEGQHTVFTYLRALGPYVFEELVLSAFGAQGYRVQRNASYAGDGGADGRVYDPSGNLMLIQSKRYRDAINPQHVKAFAHVVSKQRASGGFFVHTGRTGHTRWGHANGQVRIVSGQQLIQLLTDNRSTQRGITLQFTEPDRPCADHMAEGDNDWTPWPLDVVSERHAPCLDLWRPRGVAVCRFTEPLGRTQKGSGDGS